MHRLAWMPSAACTSVIRDLIPYELGGIVDRVHAHEGNPLRTCPNSRSQPNDPSTGPGLRHYSTQGGQQF